MNAEKSKQVYHLVQHPSIQKKSETRSLLELEGLGAEIWAGVNAQEYVNELRDEWETPVE